MDEMMMDMNIEKKKKKKKKMVDMSQYDDLGYWTKVPKKKGDNHFYGHTKCQTIF